MILGPCIRNIGKTYLYRVMVNKTQFDEEGFHNPDYTTNYYEVAIDGFHEIYDATETPQKEGDLETGDIIMFVPGDDAYIGVVSRGDKFMIDTLWYKITNVLSESVMGDTIGYEIHGKID